MSNQLAFATLSVACIGAAAAGGYYASRPAEPTEPAAVQTAASTPASTPPMALPSASAGRPAQDSEAAVSAPRKEPPTASAGAASKRVDKPPKGVSAVRHEPLSTP